MGLVINCIKLGFDYQNIEYKYLNIKTVGENIFKTRSFTNCKLIKIKPMK